MKKVTKEQASRSLVVRVLLGNDPDLVIDPRWLFEAANLIGVVLDGVCAMLQLDDDVFNEYAKQVGNIAPYMAFQHLKNSVDNTNSRSQEDTDSSSQVPMTVAILCDTLIDSYRTKRFKKSADVMLTSMPAIFKGIAEAYDVAPELLMPYIRQAAEIITSRTREAEQDSKPQTLAEYLQQKRGDTTSDMSDKHIAHEALYGNVPDFDLPDEFGYWSIAELRAASRTLRIYQELLPTYAEASSISSAIWVANQLRDVLDEAALYRTTQSTGQEEL